MAKHELENMNNRLTILNREIYNKRNEIAYLKIGVQELEGYVHGLENHNQQQQEIQNERSFLDYVVKAMFAAAVKKNKYFVSLDFAVYTCPSTM
jgi:chromosome segregation ATPase